MQFTNRIREQRQARGESLRQLAACVTMSAAHLSRLERGERGCSDECKMALAIHFGVNVTELFFVPSVAKKTTEASR